MKRSLLFIMCFFGTYFGQAQTDSTGRPAKIQYVTSEKIIEKITYFGPRNDFYKVETFLPDSTLYGIAYFAVYFPDPKGLPGLGKVAAGRQGPTKIMYPTGQVYLESNYKEGVLDGPMTLFYGDGSIKRHALYKKGHLKHNRCFDKSGQEEPCQPLVEAVHFTGKISTLKHYLKEAIRPLLKHTNVSSLRISLTVNELGQVTNTFIQFSPANTDSTIETAIKQVIVDMPQWTPGHVNFVPSRIDDVPVQDTWRIYLDRNQGLLTAYLPTP